MAGHLPSSMGRGGYHATEDYQTGSSTESRSQMVEPFPGYSMFSPSLSSDSRSASYGAQSDMNQMLLPLAIENSDIGDNPFGMPNLTDYSTGQGYSQFGDSILLPYFTTTSEVDVTQSWTMSYRRLSQLNCNATSRLPHRLYPYQGQDAPGGNCGDPANSNQRRPPLRRSQFDTTSSNLDNASKLMPLSAGQYDSRRSSDTDQVFRSSAAQNLLEARTHPLYQAQQKEDGLYHCPNEGQVGCAHKPTKSKCKYG